jgi:hypothetical protein
MDNNTLKVPSVSNRKGDDYQYSRLAQRGCALLADKAVLGAFSVSTWARREGQINMVIPK